MGSKVTEKLRRPRVIAVALVVTALAATGWAATTAAGKSQGTEVELTISLFGDFGYHDLYKKYEAVASGCDDQGVDPELRRPPLRLAKSVATGAGAADVEAIEVGFIAQFKAQPDRFVNLRQYGAGTLKDRWLSWKWAQALGRKGEIVGLGTDVGSLAICYRRDLFQKAGLPTNRAAVSKLWPTWSSFIQAGRRFQAQGAEGSHFFDSGSNVYNAMSARPPGVLRRARQRHRRDEPGGEGSMGPDHAGIAAGQSAGFAAFSERLEHGLQEGQLRHRDVPRVDDGLHPGPGPGDQGQVGYRRDPGNGGNWGGSFLTVPTQSKNAAVAADLVEFLTSPASAGVHLQADRQPAQPARAPQEQGRRWVQEPVLQQRPGRADLYELGAEAEAADHRPAAGCDPDAPRTAIAAGRAEETVPRRSRGPQFLKDVKAVTSRHRRAGPPAASHAPAP